MMLLHRADAELSSVTVAAVVAVAHLPATLLPRATLLNGVDCGRRKQQRAAAAAAAHMACLTVR